MPVLIIDTEQAELIGVALEMLEGALTARTKRVDPEQIISKALNLQALKLATVRRLLVQPEPPPFDLLDPALRKKALKLIDRIAQSDDFAEINPAWEALRGVIIAPAFPASTPA